MWVHAIKLDLICFRMGWQSSTKSIKSFHGTFWKHIYKNVSLFLCLCWRKEADLNCQIRKSHFKQGLWKLNICMQYIPAFYNDMSIWRRQHWLCVFIACLWFSQLALRAVCWAWTSGRTTSRELPLTTTTGGDLGICDGARSGPTTSSFTTLTSAQPLRSWLDGDSMRSVDGV